MITTSVATTTILPEKMGGGDPDPIEIGARGTVGNLVMKEIEYFRRLEAGSVDHSDDHGKCSINNSLKPDKKHRGDSGGSNFWPSFGFFTITWRKVKRKGGGSGRFLPKMCTVVDVIDNRHHNHSHHKSNKIPSFSYRNLKDDIKQFEV